jgi:hypothetical protein
LHPGEGVWRGIEIRDRIVFLDSGQDLTAAPPVTLISQCLGGEQSEVEAPDATRRYWA